MARFPAVGDDFAGYRILRQLGRGGMGVVFAAEHRALGRTVALKVLAPELAAMPDYRRRFEREASALARLDSPHVVQVLDHGEQDGCLYLATQYVAGGDLAEVLRTRGPLPAGQAAQLGEQLAWALADSHAAGIVHRDVKPSNVLLRDASAEVFAHLCDFGIAQDGRPGLTAPGTVAGTFAFLAPERLSGDRATPASDLYSLGCVLFTALVGAAPYGGTSDVEIGQRHLTAPVPQVADTSPVARAVNAVLQRSMAKDPARRYPDAQAMRVDLREVVRLAQSQPHPPLVPLAPLGGAASAAPSGPVGPPPSAPPPSVPPPSVPPSSVPPSSVPPATAPPTLVPSGPPSGPPPGSPYAGQQPGSPYAAGSPYASPYPAAPARRGGRTALVVAGAVAAVLAIAVGATVALVATGDDAPEARDTPTPAATSSGEPTDPATGPTTDSPTDPETAEPTPSDPTTSSVPDPPDPPDPEPQPRQRPFYPDVAPATGVRISLGAASLRAPAGWGTIDPGIVAQGVGARDYSDYEGYYSSVFIRRSVPAVPFTSIPLLELAAEAAATQLDENDDAIELTDSRPRPTAWLDGRQAVRHEATYYAPGDDLSFTEETWFVQVGRYLYRVTFQRSVVDTPAERRAQIDPMVVSFRWS